jgi:hypothetical protein
MLRRHLSGILALALTAGACSDNPVAVEEHDETLTADLTLSDDHVHTLSEISFTVVVRDHHGEAVTDLEAVTVDRLAEGGDTWRSTDLALTGSTWSAPYTFASSGEYQLRVSVMRHGATEAEVVHTMAEHLHVGRAHAEIAGYRVEFETFPGHIHEGDVAEMRFWVMEADANAEGVRPPIGGLSAHIECLESSGANEEHVAAEVELGVYAASHTYVEAGDFTATLHLSSGEEVPFITHVAHGH